MKKVPSRKDVNQTAFDVVQTATANVNVPMKLYPVLGLETEREIASQLKKLPIRNLIDGGDPDIGACTHD
ncbi:MAG: hypothetical protein IPQ13_07655 [Holophagaceae bacterium]|nr:hypothetical protein [Holophagaceae bacterium]